jgi:hypothetical protein
VLDGVKLTSGGVVRLEAVRMGGRWLTSLEALERFAAAQTPQLAAEKTTAQRSLAQRPRASEQAAKELEQLGM